MLRLVPLTDMGTDFGLRKLADRASQQLLIVGQPEVHRRPERTTTDPAAGTLTPADPALVLE